MIQAALDLLRDLLGGDARAQRYARMNAPKSAGKYTTIHCALTDAQVDEHLAGSATYAAILIGADRLVSAACVELDRDNRAGAERVLAAARRRGVVAFAIVCKGAGDHDGSHTWMLFAERVPVEHAAHLARQVAADAGYAGAEIRPTSAAIRLPFGVHTHSKTRGTLLLQSGLAYDLDDELDLDAGARVVAGLRRNEQPPAPPAPVQVERPARSAPAQVAQRGSPIEQLKRDVDLDAYLESQGYEPLYARDTSRYYRAPAHEQHAHRITVVTHPSKHGPWRRYYSYSSSGALAGRQGGDILNAIEALESKAAVDKQLASYLPDKVEQVERVRAERPHYTDEQRAAYTAAQREQRHALTRAVLDELAAQVATLDLISAVPPGVNPEAHSTRAHLLFACLLDMARDAGRLQVNPTNEQLAATLSMCERYVQYAFRELKASGLGVRRGGRNVAENEAATFTFHALTFSGCKAHQEAKCTLDIYREESCTDSQACEPARETAAALDDLDCWQACEVEVDLREVLRALDDQVDQVAQVETTPASGAEQVETAHDCACGQRATSKETIAGLREWRCAACALVALQIERRDLREALEQQPARSDELLRRLRIVDARIDAGRQPVEQVDAAPAQACEVEVDQSGAGASYDPAADLTARELPRPLRVLDERRKRRDKLRDLRLDELRTRVYSLRGAARKARSEQQRERLDSLSDEAEQELRRRAAATPRQLALSVT